MSLFNKFYSFLCMTAYKQSPRIIKHKKALTDSQSESRVIRTGKTIWYPSYKKHYYCDKPSGEGWFFRLKPIKDEGKYPVFFYMHGSGLNHAGKNDLQMYEFRWLIKKLNRHPCHQVVIHCDFTQGDYACAYNTAEHTRAVEGIIRYLEDTYKNVDRNRLYIAGTSYGGYGTAYEVLRSPDKFAAAVSSMGFTHNELYPTTNAWWQKNEYRRNLTENDFKTLAKTPFYLSWAVDDSPAITEGSDFLSKKLAKYGGKVKTKVYSKGGHTIAAHFFSESDWADWMFEQKRENPTAVNIRKATLGDEKTLAHIQTESWKSAFADIISEDEMIKHTDIAKAEKMYSEVLKANKIKVFILEADGKAQCIAALGKSRSPEFPESAELICIHSLSESRSKGYGSAMMKRVLEEAEKDGYGDILLWVFEKNARTRRFYENHGFELTDNSQTAFNSVEVMYRKNIGIKTNK